LRVNIKQAVFLSSSKVKVLALEALDSHSSYHSPVASFVLLLKGCVGTVNSILPQDSIEVTLNS